MNISTFCCKNIVSTTIETALQTRESALPLAEWWGVQHNIKFDVCVQKKQLQDGKFHSTFGEPSILSKGTKTSKQQTNKGNSFHKLACMKHITCKAGT